MRRRPNIEIFHFDKLRELTVIHLPAIPTMHVDARRFTSALVWTAMPTFVLFHRRAE